MYKYNFSICNVPIQFACDGKIEIDEDSEKFLSDDPSLIDVQISHAGEVCMPTWTVCAETANRLTWKRQEKLIRCCRMNSDLAPYFYTEYALGSCQKIECHTPKKNWEWVGRIQQIWPACMMSYWLISHNVLTFHTSYIGQNGRGILFTAPSGTGKSTQAELWRIHRGAQIINGDKAGVRIEENGVTVHGMPFSGTSGICHNVSLPLGAIAVLSQAPVNTVERLTPSRAVAALCPNVFVDQSVPEEWQMALQLLLDLVTVVPVYALACTPDVRAVEALERAIQKGM